MEAQFSGKVAIVTGSSAGLGEAIAVMMAKRGASVTLCGRDQNKLEAVADRCSKISERPIDSFLTIAGDVADRGVRRAMVEKTVEKYGRLDILVNNAGVTVQANSVRYLDEEGFDRTMDVNTKAPFFLSQLAIPHLEKSGGCIVNMSSLTSTLVSPNVSSYAISKAALDHMTRCMSFELAPLGIRVNAVNPSWIPGTELGRSFPAGPTSGPSARTLQEIPKQPLYGACVTAEEVAKSVCFLASTEALFITGQIHVIDGGRQFHGYF